ncbi:TetR/AcrR family transcriptional regulator [Paraburkholderia acidisoli]|uniref:TetR family transcriptional regulator n=1 Tax=Paraburkholderia acidisoli TaxID=2571748 RepID=A0A7Z2JJD3_9BURK|nr:TetR/AcrR family transcriptional regulator [Paraburkholderia acidisoli]QGZ65255.1 TetR family transcriptional regulator [Paraburkholderia acidisoli]
MRTVVEGAVRVFRERGYHATSLGDLSEATGLTAGSLYKAFGDKRGIFLAAFDHYVNARHVQLRRLIDAQPNARAKIHVILRSYAELSHGSEGRRGCLVVSSATALATLDDEMSARVEAAMRRTETLLRQLLDEGQKDGSVAAGVNAAAMARCLMALLQGFRLIGKAGRTQRDMLAAADEAMRLLG